MEDLRGDTNPPHDRGTEASLRNFTRTARLLDPDVEPYCDHCHEKRWLIRMPGDGWAVNCVHEPHCRHHEDNHDAVEVEVTLDDLRDYITAETLWRMDTHHNDDDPPETSEDW